MGFTKPDLPDIDPDAFLKLPLMERTRILALHWAEYGFGSPRMVHTIYIVKLVVFFTIGGITLAMATSGLGFDFWNYQEWWNDPIVYQKFILWTVLLESMNLAGSWGPLAGKAKPMMGGLLFWGRLGTIRLRPYKWVPGTAGDRRTVIDLILYYAFLISLVVTIGAPGVGKDDLSRYIGADNAGLVNPVLLIAPIALLILNGLRCKVVFLGARGEQYLPAMIFFAIFGGLVPALTSFPNMIIALKMLILVVWVGAGFSKFGKHFSNVIPPMVSNAPTIPFKAVKRAHYKNFPTDMRPSGVAHFMAHVNGTFVEIAAPLILFFATNKYLGFAAAAVMIIFHLFIISTFPLAVPLEWNVVFAWATAFLFLGFPNWTTTDAAGNEVSYYVLGTTAPIVIALIAVALLFFPVLGNLRPDKVSFLPSMRQYAGNWASALWSFAPGAEEKLNRVTRSAGNQIDQFVAAGYERNWAEVTMQMTIAWRTLHSQGRGLFSLLLARQPDIDTRTVREAEFLCNSIMGFNFGDGHFHDEDMIKAVQDEARFEPGDVLIAWVESEAFGSGVQHYKLIDPALGVIERGTWNVADVVKEQPWLPNGPVPLNPTWTRNALSASGS